WWKDKAREFEALCRGHLDLLYRFAYQEVGDRPTAEDLVQEACLKAYRALETFQPGTNYKAWLLKILKNCIVDHCRKASKEAATTGLDAMEDYSRELLQSHPPRFASPEAELLSRFAAEELDQVMADLPPECRAVVTLRFVEELKYKEIAHILGCPLGTVMSRLYQGRQILRVRLTEYVARRNERLGGTLRTTEKKRSVVNLDRFRPGLEERRKKKGS
ncbi:MAG: sigma-70 family RNA polymerase sigma factor, partial [Nitrospiraceae bacterium]